MHNLISFNSHIWVRWVLSSTLHDIFFVHTYILIHACYSVTELDSSASSSSSSPADKYVYVLDICRLEIQILHKLLQLQLSHSTEERFLSWPVLNVWHWHHCTLHIVIILLPFGNDDALWGLEEILAHLISNIIQLCNKTNSYSKLWANPI